MTNLVARKRTPAKTKAPTTRPATAESIMDYPVIRKADKTPPAIKEVDVVRTSVFKQASLPEWLMLAVLAFAVSFYVYTSFPRGSEPQPKPIPTQSFRFRMNTTSAK